MAGQPFEIAVSRSVFSEDVLRFLDQLSRKLLRDPRTKVWSDILSFAYWCRRSNLEAIAARFLGERGMIRLGRGCAFHVAPSNVPVNFAFSFVFSLLAGNSNIVRIPMKEIPQVEALCSVIREVIGEYPNISSTNVFVRYPSYSDATRFFSEIADVRILWGGDATIEKIKRFPSKPRCIDIAFSDRYSIAVVDGNAVLALAEDAMEDLAKRFYNDTYLMDQNACSSPMIVFWINGSEESQDRFWDAISHHARKMYVVQPAVSVEKYIKLCEDALHGYASNGSCAFDGLLMHIDITAEMGKLIETKGDIYAFRGKAGYFYEACIDDISYIVDVFDERLQTITYFGSQDLGMRIAKAVERGGICGVDRIVPIGCALDIDIFWDGYDLAGTLSRIVDVR